VPNVAGLEDGRYAAIVDADQPVTAVVNLVSSDPAMSSAYNAFLLTETATTFYVPSVYRNYFGFNSSIAVQNAGSSAATVTITYKRAGAADVVETRTIPPEAGFAFDQAPNGRLGNGFIGSAVVTSTQPVAVIFNVYTNTPTGQLSSSNALRDGSGSVAVPVIYNQYFDYNTSVLVQNVDTAAANVTITYYDSRTGASAGSQTATIDPGNTRLFLQFEAGGAAAPVPSSFNGSAIVTSAEGRKLVAVANVQNTRLGYLATYNGIATSTATTRASCPAILKNYFGYSTSLTVQNADAQATNLTLTYVNAAGQTVDTVSVQNLQPGATYFSFTPGLANLADGFVGAVVIQSTGAKIAAVVNELLGTGAAGDQLFTYNCFGG
jgi:hypothetical protein